MHDRRLVDSSLRAFFDAVASATTPVPASGSLTALTAAGSAALLVLVCSITQRRHPARLVEPRLQAERLQTLLLELVDEDVDAYQAYLDAKRSGAGLREAVTRMAMVPLQIGRACVDIIHLSGEIEAVARGA